MHACMHDNIIVHVQTKEKMARYGVVWCGVVWCGVVWCGVVWCAVPWCGVVCCDMLCNTRRRVTTRHFTLHTVHASFLCIDVDE